MVPTCCELHVEALAERVKDVLTDSPAVGLATVTPANAGIAREAKMAEAKSLVNFMGNPWG